MKGTHLFSFTGENTSTAASTGTIVQRDSNGNIFGNNLIESESSVTSSGGTTTLTVSSQGIQKLTGTAAHSFVLPDATTLQVGHTFEFDNNSTQVLTIKTSDSATLHTCPTGSYCQVRCIVNSTAVGSWDTHWLMPTNAVVGTTGIILTGLFKATEAISGGNGTVTVPGFNFTNRTDCGMYVSGSSTWGFAIGGVQSMDFAKSTGGGNFGNVGIGGAASVSDVYPLLMQRTSATAINVQLSNPSTDAGSGSKYQVVAGSGAHVGEIGMFAAATAAPDAYSGGRMTVRATDSCPGLSYISDGAITANHIFYAGGNGATHRIATIGYSGVVIGTTTSTAQFDTTGSVRMRNFGAGTATFDANGNVSSVSDERMKHVLRDFTSGLPEVCKIKPIIYKWNERSGLETDMEYAGFSAQNVQKAIPMGVGENHEGILSIQDRAIIAALVNSIKELNERITKLESKGVAHASLA